MESSPGAYISDLNIDDTEKYYSLSGDELRFCRTMTGSTDEQQLRDHCIAIKHETYKVGPRSLL